MTAKEIQEDRMHEITDLKSGELQDRLAEMGCVPGTLIKKLYSAPGGDPIAYQVDHYILGLRKLEADYIEVKAVEELSL
jgi:Fe2+ transport system protein FeoA